jgi:hypothetical protein
VQILPLRTYLASAPPPRSTRPARPRRVGLFNGPARPARVGTLKSPSRGRAWSQVLCGRDRPRLARNARPARSPAGRSRCVLGGPTPIHRVAPKPRRRPTGGGADASHGNVGVRRSNAASARNLRPSHEQADRGLHPAWQAFRVPTPGAAGPGTSRRPTTGARRPGSITPSTRRPFTASDEKGAFPMQHRDRRHVVRDRIIAAEVLKLELRRDANRVRTLTRRARAGRSDGR